MITEQFRPSNNNGRPASMECLLDRIPELEEMLRKARFQAWIIQAAVDRTIQAATDALVNGLAQKIASEKRFAWLRTIALRNAATVARQARRRVSQTFPLDSIALDGSPIVTVGSEQLQRALHAALAKLAKNLREVVEAYFWCGFSFRDGAQLLDLSVGTFRRRLNEALERLRDDLGKLEADLP